MRQNSARKAVLMIFMIASMPGGVSHAGAFSVDTADTPQGRTAEARWEKFEADNARSGDLRRQLLFGRDAITLEQFVERARGSTDPFVLSTLSERCDHAKQEAASSRRAAGDAVPEGCDAVEFARRWVAADTQNQLAWLTLAKRLDRRGDVAGARAALERAARASSYRTFVGETTRTIFRIRPRGLNNFEQLAFMYATLGIEAATPIPSFPELFRLCKPPDMHDDCVRIADVMFRDSETLSDLFTATDLSAKLSVERETLRYRIQRSSAMRWIWWQGIASDDPAIDDSAAIERFMRETERRASLGELAWLREALRQRGVSEADAAARLDMSMTQEQRLHYEAVRKPWSAATPSTR